MRVPRKLQKEGRARLGLETLKKTSKKTSKKTWFDGAKVSQCSFLHSAGLFSPVRYTVHGLSFIHCFNSFRGFRHYHLGVKRVFVWFFFFSNRHHGPREISLYLCPLFIFVQYYPHLILTCGGMNWGFVLYSVSREFTFVSLLLSGFDRRFK